MCQVLEHGVVDAIVSVIGTGIVTLLGVVLGCCGCCKKRDAGSENQQPAPAARDVERSSCWWLNGRYDRVPGEQGEPEPEPEYHPLQKSLTLGNIMDPPRDEI